MLKTCTECKRVFEGNAGTLLSLCPDCLEKAKSTLGKKKELNTTNFVKMDELSSETPVDSEVKLHSIAEALEKMRMGPQMTKISKLQSPIWSDLKVPEMPTLDAFADLTVARRTKKIMKACAVCDNEFGVEVEDDNFLHPVIGVRRALPAWELPIQDFIAQSVEIKDARDRIVKRIMAELARDGRFSVEGLESFWKKYENELCPSCKSEFKKISAKKKEALNLLNKAVSIDPENDAARKNLEAIKKMQ